MKILYTLFCVLALTCGHAAMATVHTITTPGFFFSPSTLTINLGDTVQFSIGGNHNAVEVSQSTWNANGNTSNGGFSLPFGGGIVVLQNTGTYYYVCQPHASMGMKGTISVENLSLSTGTISPLAYCAGDNISIPYTITGVYGASNIFTAQLSDAAGGFASPAVLGTRTATTGGTIAGTIPSGTATGTGYRVRVVSSDPILTAAPNGANVTVNAFPSASITPSTPQSICQGDTAFLTANPGGFTYQWRRNNVAIGGATNQNFSATLAGTYTVVVSNGSCSTTSSGVQVSIIPADPAKLTWTGAGSGNWLDPGNWDNPCAIPSNGDTIVIPPAVTPPQNIPSITLTRLVLNNGAGLTLTNSLQIAGSLVMTNGHITLGDNNLTLGTSATISGYSATSFIITNGTGELRQAGLGGAGRIGPIVFPVGPVSTRYTPVAINNGGTIDEFSVRARDAVLANGTSGAPLSSNAVGNTWLISEASAGGSDATLTFGWNEADELPSFDRANCYVAHHDGTTWSALQTVGAASGSNPYERTVGGVTAFSPFAIGDGSSTLPVRLVSFRADARSGGVHLHWETAGEHDFFMFEVQRRELRANASWIVIGQLPGRNAKGGVYTHDDTFEGTTRPAGEIEYRLRMIDMDGRSSYSPAVAVSMEAAPADLRIVDISPNPGNNLVTVRFSLAESQAVSFNVYDLRGAHYPGLSEQRSYAAGTHALTLPSMALAGGMYVLELRAATSTRTALFSIVRK